MKRIISFIITAVVIMASLCIVPGAAPAPLVKLEAVPRTVHSGDKQIVVDIVMKVAENNDVTAFGFQIGFDDKLLTLKNAKNGNIGGMATGAQSYDQNPYTWVWVGATFAIEDGKHTVATLTFDVNNKNGAVAGTEYKFTLESYEGGSVISMDGHSYLQAGECTFTGGSATAMAETYVTLSLLAHPIYEGADEFYADLVIEVQPGHEISAVGVLIDYDDVQMELKSAKKNMKDSVVSGGLSVGSQKITENPYSFIWVTESGKLSGGKHTIATFTFAIKDDAAVDDVYSIGLFANTNGGPVVGFDTHNYTANNEVEYFGSEVVVRPGVAGDLNNDGGLDATDAITLLRYLAAWNMKGEVSDRVNLCGDFNLDGVVNSADVIYLLRALNGWSGYII